MNVESGYAVLNGQNDNTAYAGLQGFALESESYADIERGVESTLLLRHPGIPAAFRLVARVFPEEGAYETVPSPITIFPMTTEMPAQAPLSLSVDPEPGMPTSARISKRS